MNGSILPLQPIRHIYEYGCTDGNKDIRPQARCALSVLTLKTYESTEDESRNEAQERIGQRHDIDALKSLHGYRYREESKRTQTPMIMNPTPATSLRARGGI